ncbi:hypothetical protein [Lysobacter sp. CA199]|uniref:hypothetical protein n=1 Tax=Lysobacter sp. CA199 TaxID=3455608 RepID=UPI003F8D36DA
MPNITIYEHANFLGRSQALAIGRYDDTLAQISIGNDTISSVKVPAGMAVRLYQHARFQGAYIDLREDLSLLTPTWNEKTSSLVVYAAADTPPPTREVMIYEHSEFTGRLQVLGPGRYDAANLSIGDNSLSSLLVPSGMIVRLYELPNFQGAFVDVNEDTAAISMDWNDRVSSIVVSEAVAGFAKLHADNDAIRGESLRFNGVRGVAHSDRHAGVSGSNVGDGPGVQGRGRRIGVSGDSRDGYGLYGHSGNYHAIWGEADRGAGVVGIAKQWHGVYGETYSTVGGAGLWGEHKTNGIGVVGVAGPGGIAVCGRGGRLAGYFEGDVEVTGDIRLINADCAENFNIATDAAVEPGTVMVLDEELALSPSQRAYDRRVAGVVSGAGDFKPGIVLDNQPSERLRQPVALLGKVFCKVDAAYGAIEVGDLLTTSPTPGHAMKAGDAAQAGGAVIGKALRGFEQGRGLVPILISLQ